MSVNTHTLHNPVHGAVGKGIIGLQAQRFGTQQSQALWQGQPERCQPWVGQRGDVCIQRKTEVTEINEELDLKEVSE